MGNALALLPLLIVLFAAWRYDLLANVRSDYRWLVGTLFVGFAALAGGAHIAAQRGWRHAALLPMVAACVPLAGIVLFAGWASAFATVVLIASALALASCFHPASPSGIAIALMAGMACLMALVGWLLPFPIHHRAVYLVAAVVLIVARWRVADHAGRGGALRATMSANPGWSILLIGATSIASLGLWLPSLNYDDNAVHLILPSQLLADGYYRLDVQTQSWAVAPWANNVLHAIAAVFAGQEARASVALLWLLLGMSGAWRLARAVGASPQVALAAAAVFAAQPLTGYFTTTMQVDGASAAVLLHLAAVAAMPVHSRPGAAVIGLLAGLLLALKTSNLVYCLPVLAWLVVSLPGGTRARWFGTFVLCLLPVAASSYAYAWLVTGNPLFPFYNAVFKSPYYPLENFRDLKWMAGVSWRSLWDIAFKTNAYGQFFPGAAGLAVLATLPALIVDAARRPQPRWLLLWALATGLLLFWFMQYLRYIFPALAVLAVLGTVALARFAHRRAFAAAVMVLVLADAMLMPTTSWIARENHWAQLLREGPAARTDIERKVMPERALLSRIVARDPNACVLMSNPRAPFVGTGRGHAISLHRRYDPELWRARNDAEADASGGKWRALLARIGASHVIVDSGKEPLLAQTLAGMGHVVLDREGALEVRGAADEQARRCVPALRASRDRSVALLPMLGNMR
ncbi:MAG: hypothetical protein IPO74_06715 [Thermomonas sp.]|nr:hypothetical protein [Thermomonas sp.]